MILAGIDFWHWWILGLALLVLEVFAPGAFFLWMGVAAGFTGLILYLFPMMGWEYQVMIFAVLSVASIVIWRQYLRKVPAETDQPSLNRRGEQYVGRVFTLDNPIENGFGKIHVDDSIWKINGEDCEAGTRVKIVGVDGVIFRVEKQ